MKNKSFIRVCIISALILGMCFMVDKDSSGRFCQSLDIVKTVKAAKAEWYDPQGVVYTQIGETDEVEVAPYYEYPAEEEEDSATEEDTIEPVIVHLPETVVIGEKTYRVTRFAKGAFKHSHDTLEEITIPGSMKTITKEAFQECPNLRKVTIEEGVEEIGTAAFIACPKLKEISLPNSLKKIGDYAFGSYFDIACTALKKITIPENVTIIGKDAFSCSGLKRVIIKSKKIKKIKSGAFWYVGRKRVAKNFVIKVPKSKLKKYKKMLRKGYCTGKIVGV